MKKINLIACILCALLISGCFWETRGNLKRQDLFTVELGTLPHEIDWFYREGYRIAGVADIEIRDGLVYISTGEVGKVMLFNSYGELITLVYDAQKNPHPLELEEGTFEISMQPWTFNNPQVIATIDEGFLVEDGVDPERRIKDDDTGLIFDRVILRFNQDGEYLGHLGREGYGGSPFPYVSNINVRDDGSIVVTSRLPGLWMSYWFDKDGLPLATVSIRDDQLPVMINGGNVTVYSVRPDPVEWVLYIRMDVYPAQNTDFKPEAYLVTLDLTTLEYGEPITLSYSDDHELAIPPDYLGTITGGYHVFFIPDGTHRYRLNLVDKEGTVIQNRRITIGDDDNIYLKFKLQNDGKLVSILFDDQKATISLWRLDKLIP